MSLDSQKTTDVDAAFARTLPKIELHAHLTGSITPKTLHEIWLWGKRSEPDLVLQDPLIAMSLDKVWDIRTFFPLFSSYIYELCSSKESLIYSTNAVLCDFRNDGVVYLELRTTPRSSDSLSKEEYITTILECIENFSGKNRMHTYLILSIDRRNTALEAMEVVDLAISHKKRSILGVDLCGDPNKYHTNIASFAPAFAKAKQSGLNITLHFAEVPASASNAELQTLLSFQPDRLGHVIHVPENGEVMNEILRRKIGVELCLSCNVQAKLTPGGVADHHFKYWHQTKCPVILCVSVFLSFPFPSPFNQNHDLPQLTNFRQM